MTDQEILDNAPEGMTSAIHDTFNQRWLYSVQRNIRSLADIAKIAELEKEVYVQKVYIDHALDNSKEQLIKRIAELEKALATSFEFLSMSQTAEYLFYETNRHLVKDQSK